MVRLFVECPSSHILRDVKGDMVKHELRLKVNTSCELKAPVEIQKCEFKTTSSYSRVTSSTSGVTKSNHELRVQINEL